MKSGCAMLRRLMAVTFLVSSFTCIGAEENTTQTSIDPQVDKIVRAVSDKLRNAKSLSVNVTSSVKMTASGMRNEMESKFEVALERPSKFAFLLKDGMIGDTLVSDGTTVTEYAPLTKSYSQKAAPGDLDELLSEVFPSSPSSTLMNLRLFGSEPYDMIMEGVTSGVYVGRAEKQGKECHHLKFSQDFMDWEAWVPTKGDPVLLQLAGDMSKGMQLAGEEVPEVRNMKMVIEVSFSDWKFDAPISPRQFAFEPPADAELVVKDDEDGAPASELLGKPAPAFDLPSLDGGNVRLSDMTSSVVVLDFWATWCPPCRKGLPILEKVAKELEPKGVRFLAVNLGETTETITEFLEKEKLHLKVALDEDNVAGDAYQASSIPTTVLIGMDGTVQAVHAGLSRNMEEELTSQAEALLRGETLAQPAAETSDNVTTSPEMGKLSEAWKLDGKWSGVMATPDGKKILALGQGGKVGEFSPDGKLISETRTDSSRSVLRLANQGSGKQPLLVTFTGWQGDVEVFPATGGKRLWAYPAGQGVDDVWCCDLDGDGIDEIVVGFNGSTGLHVVSSQGKLVWKNARIGNVWHVCTGDLDSDGKAEVISTSAQGKVHIFDATGKKKKDIDPGIYSSMARFADPGNNAVVIVGGSGDRGEMAVCCDYSGAKKWKTALGSGNDHVLSAAVSPQSDLVAFALKSGSVVVLDVASGRKIGTVEKLGSRIDVSWANLENGGSTRPVLLIATGQHLAGFHVSRTDE